MTRRRTTLASLLLLLLSAPPGRAFVLETSARVEIVPWMEISPLTPERSGPDSEPGLRLRSPGNLSAQVVLEENDGMGGRRKTPVENPDDAVVRWEASAWSCHLTVTYE